MVKACEGQHSGKPSRAQGLKLGSSGSANLCTHRAHVLLLTQLAHFQDLAQHLGQFYTAAAEGTLVLVLPAAVLEHNLHGEREVIREGIL